MHLEARRAPASRFDRRPHADVRHAARERDRARAPTGASSAIDEHRVHAERRQRLVDLRRGCTVGKPIVAARARSPCATTPDSMCGRRQHRARPRRDRPRAMASRTRVLDHGPLASPTSACDRVSKPSVLAEARRASRSRRRARGRSGSSSPTTTTRAREPLRRSTRSANSSGVCAANARSNAHHDDPDRGLRRARMSSILRGSGVSVGGAVRPSDARPGAERTSAPTGSSPRRSASRAASASTAWCPRCTPSKLPMATRLPPDAARRLLRGEDSTAAT